MYKLIGVTIECRMPVEVICDGELVDVIPPKVGRQTVVLSCEDVQRLVLHSDMPFSLYSAEEGELGQEDVRP